MHLSHNINQDQFLLFLIYTLDFEILFWKKSYDARVLDKIIKKEKRK